MHALCQEYLLVPSQDPDPDPSIGQALNGLWHSSLKLVFDSGAAQQQQLTLYQVPDCRKLVITPCQCCFCFKVLLLPPVDASECISDICSSP